LEKGFGEIISDMAIKKMGMVKMVAIMNFFNSFLYVFTSALSSTSFGTRSIPQIGQLPGSFFSISGCIGHVKTVFLTAEGCSTKSIPHTGQSPGLLYVLSPSQCMGQ